MVDSTELIKTIMPSHKIQGRFTWPFRGYTGWIDHKLHKLQPILETHSDHAPVSNIPSVVVLS